MHKRYTKDLKVVFIQAVPRFGGALMSLFLLMKSSKFTPVLITSRKGRLTELCENEGIKYYTVDMPMWRKLKSWLRIPFRLVELLKIVIKEDPSIIYANTLWDIPYAVVIGLICKKKVVGHIRNTFTHDKIKKYLLPWTDLLVSVSFTVCKPLWFTHIKWRVVYNGVPESNGHSSFKKGKPFKISLVGRIDSTKGQDIAIEALHLVCEKVKDVELLIAGEESYLERGLLERLKNRAQNLGVGDKVKFLGHIDDVYSLYRDSCISLIPSKESSREGFGRVIPESYINKTPVIATGVGGIPEVVRDKKTGFIVNIEPEDFSNIILLYRAQPLLVKKHAINGFLLTRQKFLLRNTSKSIENLLGSLR